MTKILIEVGELESRGNISQHYYGHLSQTHSQHHTQWEKRESLPIKFKNKTKMPMLITFIQNNIGSPSHNNQRRKINERYSYCKRRVKIVIMCIRHYTSHIDSKNLHPKILRANKSIEKGSRIQN